MLQCVAVCRSVLQCVAQMDSNHTCEGVNIYFWNSFIWMHSRRYIYVYSLNSLFHQIIHPNASIWMVRNDFHRETKGLEGGLPSKLLCHGKHTCFETPENQMFSWFVPPIGSCSQFCLILQPHRVAVPFPPTFASPWRNSFVLIHGGTTLLKAKFGTTPQKWPKNDLNWGGGLSYGTNKPTLPNPSFPYEFIWMHLCRYICVFSEIICVHWIFAQMHPDNTHQWIFKNSQVNTSFCKNVEFLKICKMTCKMTCSLVHSELICTNKFHHVYSLNLFVQISSERTSERVILHDLNSSTRIIWMHLCNCIFASSEFIRSYRWLHQ